MGYTEISFKENWQAIDLSTMIFPAELRFDYVRVYQRKGQTNVGCDPANYPTMSYITAHPEAYSSEFFVEYVFIAFWSDILFQILI